MKNRIYSLGDLDNINPEDKINCSTSYKLARAVESKIISFTMTKKACHPEFAEGEYLKVVPTKKSRQDCVDLLVDEGVPV